MPGSSFIRLECALLPGILESLRYPESPINSNDLNWIASYIWGIAAATVASVDVLASWNFRHMVNFRRIRQYNEVNRRMGYPPLDIRTPEELGNDD